MALDEWSTSSSLTQDDGTDWTAPVTSLKPASTGSGSGFLSSLGSGLGGLGGLASGLLGAVNPMGMVADLGGKVLDAAKDAPINQTGTAKQSGAFSFANAFQVGGKGNSLTSTPSVTGAPADSSAPAFGAGGNQNMLLYIGGGLVLVAILVFGLRRK